MSSNYFYTGYSFALGEDCSLWLFHTQRATYPTHHKVTSLSICSFIYTLIPFLGFILSRVCCLQFYQNVVLPNSVFHNGLNMSFAYI